MRTTLTLDDDVARELQRLERSTQQRFKTVVNDVLRRGLACGEVPAKQSPRFIVKPKAAGFLPGIDPLKLNQLVDELETARFSSKSRRRGKE